MHRRLLVAALLAAGIVSCSESTHGGPRLTFDMRADSMSLFDSMTVEIWAHDADGNLMDRTGPTWRFSDTTKLAVQKSVIPWPRIKIFARDTGKTWVVASAAGLKDSVLLRVVLMPIRTAGFSFHDPINVKWGTNKSYHPFDGMCFSFTNETFKQMIGEDYWFWQIGSFVVDARRNPWFRGNTVWSYSNPSVLEIKPATDSLNDVLMRPLNAGHTKMIMDIGTYTGWVDIFVDPVNLCQGIVPGLARAMRVSPPDKPAVWVW